MDAGEQMAPEEQAKRFYAHVWLHRAHVLRLARFLTRDAGEADDLAQEALMRAFRKIEHLDVADNAKGWLASILRNVRIDQMRLRSASVVTGIEDWESAAVAEPAGATPNPRELSELLEALSDQSMIDALHRIPEEIRWALLLVDVEQLTYDDAAQIMDVPAGTVKSRVHRGHQMLREQILTRSPGLKTSRLPTIKPRGGAS